MSKERTMYLTDVSNLLKLQKKAHVAEMKLMGKLIEDLERQLNTETEEGHLTYLWFTQIHPEMAEEFVKAAYKRIPKYAEGAVGWLHDETLDLSTVGCSSKAFKPWGLR